MSSEFMTECLRACDLRKFDWACSRVCKLAAGAFVQLQAGRFVSARLHQGTEADREQAICEHLTVENWRLTFDDRNCYHEWQMVSKLNATYVTMCMICHVDSASANFTAPHCQLLL